SRARERDPLQGRGDRSTDVLACPLDAARARRPDDRGGEGGELGARPFGAPRVVEALGLLQLVTQLLQTPPAGLADGGVQYRRRLAGIGVQIRHVEVPAR